MTAPQTFQKKPVQVQAMPWDGTEPGAKAVLAWILGGGGQAFYSDALPEREIHGATIEADDACIAVKTLEGWMRYPHGWTFIRGIKGEFYACENDIFADSYEPVIGL